MQFIVPYPEKLLKFKAKPAQISTSTANMIRLLTFYPPWKKIDCMPFLRKVYAFTVDFFETLVIAGGIFVIIYAFLFRPFQVNGQSMFPTFHDGEYILTNLITLRLEPPKRGDVIVFIAPVDHEKDFIKRVIGLPGDTVMVSGGHVYVNGQLLDESAYLSPDVKTGPGAFLGEGVTIKVPPNNYFVMGDNREFSSDSREWGFVSKDKLIGKSMLVYWPPQRFKIVTGVQYSLKGD